MQPDPAAASTLHTPDAVVLALAGRVSVFLLGSVFPRPFDSHTSFVRRQRPGRVADMPRNLRAFRVFIASPGGLWDEREVFRQTLEAYNRSEALPHDRLRDILRRYNRLVN